LIFPKGRSLNTERSERSSFELHDSQVRFHTASVVTCHRRLPATTCRSRRAPNSLQTGHGSARHRSLEQPLAEFRWGFHCRQGRVLPGAGLWLAGEVTYVTASSGVSPNVKPVSSRVAVGAEIARWNSAVSVARGRQNRVIDRPTRQARKPRGLARLIGDLGRVADQV